MEKSKNFDDLWRKNFIFCGYEITSRYRRRELYCLVDNLDTISYNDLARGYHCDVDSVRPVIYMYVGGDEDYLNNGIEELARSVNELSRAHDIEFLYIGDDGLYSGYNCDNTHDIAEFLTAKGVKIEEGDSVMELLEKELYTEDEVCEWATDQDLADLQESPIQLLDRANNLIIDKENWIDD